MLKNTGAWIFRLFGILDMVQMDLMFLIAGVGSRKPILQHCITEVIVA